MVNRVPFPTSLSALTLPFNAFLGVKPARLSIYYILTLFLVSLTITFWPSLMENKAKVTRISRIRSNFSSTNYR